MEGKSYHRINFTAWYGVLMFKIKKWTSTPFILICRLSSVTASIGHTEQRRIILVGSHAMKLISFSSGHIPDLPIIAAHSDTLRHNYTQLVKFPARVQHLPLSLKQISWSICWRYSFLASAL